MKKISVIVPVYKAEQYLTRCIESILHQTYGNIELILIDDGSPDLSLEICYKYAEGDSRVIVVHQENQGVAVARNTGLDRATGDYVTFVDSDDYIDKEMYESMLNIAEKYDTDVVMCDCVKEFETHNEVYSHDIRSGFYNREQLETEYFPHLLVMPNVEYPATISNCLCIFKKDKYCNLNIMYEKGIRYSEDWLFGAMLMHRAESFYYMKNENFYHYNCMNMNSATKQIVPDKWNDYKLLYRRISEEFRAATINNIDEQIDKVLLFLVYNSVGELINCSKIDTKRSVEKINCILNDDDVKKMFDNLKIINLPISWKLKLMTYSYKHNIGKRLWMYVRRYK